MPKKREKSKEITELEEQLPRFNQATPDGKILDLIVKLLELILRELFD